MSDRIVVITGANSGVGFMLAKRLLLDSVKSQSSLTVCLACRNLNKAEDAKRQLVKFTAQEATRLGDADLADCVSVDLVRVDTCDLQSVADAAEDLKKRYPAIDRLVLNAGILPISVSNIRFSAMPAFMKDPSPSNVSKVFHQHNPTLPNGLPSIFCTNLFGHHCLVTLLKDYLTHQSRPCRIIWTSSRAARKQYFQLDDVQHNGGADPYSSSKITCDAACIGWHETFAENSNVSSYSSCPGLCLSGLTDNILPQFVWYIILPILYLARLFSTIMTISLENGSEAAFYLCQCKDSEPLDYRSKYIAEGRIGRTSVGREKIPISSDEASQLLSVLDDMASKQLSQIPINS